MRLKQIRLARRMQEKGQERSKLKRSILSILYGANNGTVKRLSKMKESQITKIKEIIKVE